VSGATGNATGGEAGHCGYLNVENDVIGICKCILSQFD
jgi:hypothetical protein